MGNEPSKRATPPSSGQRGTSHANTGKSGGKSNANHKAKNGQRSKDNKKLHMEESAQSFAPKNAPVTAKFKRGGVPVMITDALSDVRVNYHIEAKELGHGHYGVVRKCMHRETGEWYAIKSIRKAKVSKIEVLKREIEILKEVKHPNIIALTEVYEDERYLHLITELCTGGELFDRIIAKTQSAEGHFSEHDAAKLVGDILDAIRYCHEEKGIVHRDLKPENFLFKSQDDDADIKIIDFGLSRHDDANLGIMQTKVGTPYYVAPEVLRREYTKSCDIWSIGVITYILLCGYPPFYGDSDTQIFESVKVGKFDFPSPEWDDISKAAKDFVISMLKKNPKDRPEASAALKHPWLKEQLGDELVRKTNISHSGLKFGEFSKYLAMKKLKKAALGQIAGHLTQSEFGALEETFRSLDHNGDGTITVHDLREAIEQGDFTTELKESLSELRRELSLSGEAKLNYKDFVAATMDRNLAMREDNIRVAFDHFRHTEADYLTLEDLSDVFGREAPAKELMNFLDYDGDGKISFEDFRHAVAETFDEDDAKEDVEMKTESEDVDMDGLD